ncbi:secondary thiamine-phosphate synthase enzyme [Tremella mesenterica]|uniref:Secondary thiamine-phosphate synthase enzyme n=1 Tax=Tremella mesenterica TaxID=5217 RepID=A0A4Q1BNS3_TREME|nr:secondary thiamine-phosphate synthase enzyme [Tremella mesenterica]
MHLITDVILRECAQGLKDVSVGIFTLNCLHTSAGLTVNENCDPLDTVVPESLPWQHTDEGPDDSVSHLKTSLIGNSITLPISAGKLHLGTWQGIYLAEFRHSGGGWGLAGSGRKVVATILP